MKNCDDDGDDEEEEDKERRQFVKFILISGNVGSLFENVTLLMTQWVDEIAGVIAGENAKFIAIHLQEVGGKNYANSMKYVETFRNYLIEHNAFSEFDRCLVLSDEDFMSNEQFTGKCSRKGFMRTRWSIEGTVMDFVNVHLFHDISNFVAMESYPSVYSSNRTKALNYLLDRSASSSSSSLPTFIFGDFNFRLDTKSFINEITRSSVRKSTINSQIHYYDSNNDPVLILGNKNFIFNQKMTFLDNPQQLKKYDKELQLFEAKLHEFPITFPPSYPFEEMFDKPKEYMSTRCPAWCDRILFNCNAKFLIDFARKPKYDLIGIDKCMGDHKPVYCAFDLKKLQHSKENPISKNTEHPTSYISISSENQPIKVFKQSDL